ncbi:MAG: EamA family transporter RarD [Alphaproteobacteria bacterium]
MSQLGKGYAFTIGAFLMWGVLPLIIKPLSSVPVLELMVHRIFWTFVLVGLVVLATGRLVRSFRSVAKPRDFWMIVASSLMIGINWLIFVYAVATEQALQASLGYFINPLVSVLLGLFVLKEKLTPLQTAAVVAAAIGVLIKVSLSGGVPWIALALAGSFGLYGLIRKVVEASALEGLFLETLIWVVLIALALPIAFGLGIDVAPKADFDDFGLMAGLVLLGAWTVLPLWFFAAGTRIIPLAHVGLCQYIAPSIQFLIAVFLFGEHFTTVELVTFGCVWIGLMLFAIDMLKGRTNAPA